MTTTIETPITTTLVHALSGDDLGLLAERLSPYLPKSQVSGDRWLTSKEAAGYLGMPYSSLKKLTASRAIPFEQSGPGCKCYFRASELDVWRLRGGCPADSEPWEWV